MKTLDTRQLGRRGVVSLGVNNCAASVPVRAWTFSDPQFKFHHSLFLDPSVITFAPAPKLRSHIRVQRADGSFTFVNTRVADCPNTIGYARSAAFCPSDFLTSWFASWGMGGHQHKKGDQYRALMLDCKTCGKTGVCPFCNGDKCAKCRIGKRKKPTGECAKCAGVGLLRPFTRQATMLIGLRLLCHLGLKRIYCIGIDFDRPSKDEGYGFDEVGSGGTSVYEKEDKMLRMVKPHLDRAGIEVFNCSPQSRCTAFAHRDFDDAIKDCTRYMGSVRTRGWYSKKEIKSQRKAKWEELEGVEV